MKLNLLSSNLFRFPLKPLQLSSPKYFSSLSSNEIISDIASLLSETPNVDIESLPVHFMSYLRSSKRVPEAIVNKILESSISSFTKLPNVLQLSRPALENGKKGSVIVCGDTHGQFYDFCEIFRDDVGGLPSKSNTFLFNGDIVDRGPMACEILLFLLTMKIINPNLVHILRGNHETVSMSTNYGFKREVTAKYGQSMFYRFQEFFNTLPLAAVIEEKIFVCHGGLGPKSAVMTIEQLNELDRKNEPDDDNAMYELLWADPKEIEGFRPNFLRGGTVCFGKNVTQYFLNNNKLGLLVRSHEVQQQGYNVHHDGKCITIFSAPNYCGSERNKGAILKLDGEEELRASIIQFNAFTSKPKN